MRKLAPGTPVAVGFGISKAEHVKAVTQAGADAAIVGSAYVKLIGRDVKASCEKLAALSKELKNGLQ